MGEAKRRKKLDSNFGKNKLASFVTEQTLLKGRGILLISDFDCSYFSKKEYISEFVIEANSPAQAKYQSAVELIENYDPKSEVVVLSSISNSNFVHLFVDDLEKIKQAGQKYKNLIRFLPN